MRTGLALLGILVLCGGAAGQGSPAKLTLEDAFRRSMRQHPAAARSEHLAAAAGERVRQAQAGLMPSLAFQASATNGPLGAPAMGLLGMAGDPVKKHYGSGLNLIQPIYDFGRTQHLVASRRSIFHAAEQESATLDAQILLEVQTAYLNVLRKQQLVEVYRENVRQREATAAQAQTLSDSGLKADVDAQLAKANLADARVALIGAENEVKVAFAALNNALGETKLTEYSLEPPSAGQQPTLQSSSDEAIRAALKDRPEVKGAGLQIDAADQAVKAARSDLLPRFDGIASAGALTKSPVITSNQWYAVGVSVTFPLYTGGNVEGRVAEEKQRKAAAADQERELREAIKLQVTRAWLEVQSRTAQVAAAREQVSAAESSRRQATERYRLQLNSVVELTDAEAAAVRAQAQLVNAEYDLSQARAELDWATGTTVLRYAPAQKK